MMRELLDTESEGAAQGIEKFTEILVWHGWYLLLCNRRDTRSGLYRRIQL